MKKLLTNSVQLGTHYYKAPFPNKKEWENDLKKMSELDVKMVKFCIQWRRNHPQEGNFYFDDIDRLMELSKKYNLHVVLSIIFDEAPVWIYNKYPDASMVTLSGRKIGSAVALNSQFGGLGYCFNHDAIMKHFFEFLTAVVDRYKDHPALEIWDVGSQPELINNMPELRRIANNPDKIGDLLCYCDNCKAKFKEWIQNKYSDIQKLNASWDQNFSSFENIEIPQVRNNINDLIDWRMFFLYTFRKSVVNKFEVVRSIDYGRHPLMCNNESIQAFPFTSVPNPPENVDKNGDNREKAPHGNPGVKEILSMYEYRQPAISA